MQPIREYIDRHTIGIFGTIIFHLVLLLIFMLVKVSTSYKELSDILVLNNVEIQRLQDILDQQIPDREEALAEEKVFYHNIAVNQARVTTEAFDLENYAEKVREQMLAEGVIHPENWGNEGELANHLQKLESASLESEEAVSMPEEEISSKESDQSLLDLENSYKGPTRISYFLEGRNRVFMPLPIYKCPGGGKVVILIVVDPYGDVVETKIDTQQSGTLDYCLAEAAEEAARRTKFNKDRTAPARQNGSITYIFQAQ